MCFIIPAFRGWSPKIGTNIPDDCFYNRPGSIPEMIPGMPLSAVSWVLPMPPWVINAVTRRSFRRSFWGIHDDKWRFERDDFASWTCSQTWFANIIIYSITIENASSGSSYFQMNVISGNRPITVAIDSLMAGGKSTDFATEPNEIKILLERWARILFQLWNRFPYFSFTRTKITKACLRYPVVLVDEPQCQGC